MGTIRMEELVRLLQERGTEALVEETGGGNPCVFAGPTMKDPEGFQRYAVLAGPGWWEDGVAVFDRRDFSWGPHDNVDDLAFVSVPAPDAAAADIADALSDLVQVVVAATLLAAADLSVHDGTRVADADLTGSQLDRVAALRTLYRDEPYYLQRFDGWDVRPYAQRDGEPTEVDVILYGEFSHDVPVFEGSASTAYDFLHPGRYDVRVAGLPLFAVLQVTDDWSGITRVAA